MNGYIGVAYSTSETALEDPVNNMHLQCKHLYLNGGGTNAAVNDNASGTSNPIWTPLTERNAGCNFYRKYFHRGLSHL